MRVQWRLHGSTDPWRQGELLSHYEGDLITTTLRDEAGAVVVQGPIMVQYQGELLHAAFVHLTNANLYEVRPAGWGQGVLYRVMGGTGQRHWRRATIAGIDPPAFTEADTGEVVQFYFGVPYFTADGLLAHSLHTSGPDDARPWRGREGAVEIRAGGKE